MEDAEKEDVYQLGVILIQVITGKPIKSTRELDELKLEVVLIHYIGWYSSGLITLAPIQLTIFVSLLLPQLEKCLAESPSKLRGAADPSVRGTYAYDSLRTTVEITMNCLCKDSARRPSIEDALWNLQYSIQVQDGWTSSGNLNTHI